MGFFRAICKTKVRATENKHLRKHIIKGMRTQTGEAGFIKGTGLCVWSEKRERVHDSPALGEQPPLEVESGEPERETKPYKLKKKKKSQQPKWI